MAALAGKFNLPVYGSLKRHMFCLPASDGKHPASQRPPDERSTAESGGWAVRRVLVNLPALVESVGGSERLSPFLPLLAVPVRSSWTVFLQTRPHAFVPLTLPSGTSAKRRSSACVCSRSRTTVDPSFSPLPRSQLPSRLPAGGLQNTLSKASAGFWSLPSIQLLQKSPRVRLPVQVTVTR